MSKMDVGAIVPEPGARVLFFPSRSDDADFRTKETFRPHITHLELLHLDPLITPRRLSKSFCCPYLRTYSMEQSPSWQDNRFSVSQEIPHIS